MCEGAQRRRQHTNLHKQHIGYMIHVSPRRWESSYFIRQPACAKIEGDWTDTPPIQARTLYRRNAHVLANELQLIREMELLQYYVTIGIH